MMYLQTEEYQHVLYKSATALEAKKLKETNFTSGFRMVWYMFFSHNPPKAPVSSTLYV